MSYAVEHFSDTYINDEGAICWTSNDRALLEDCVQDLWKANLIRYGVVHKTRTFREKQTEMLISQYAAARQHITEEQKAEEAAERRAAFGRGEEVVNILTGERYFT